MKQKPYRIHFVCRGNMHRSRLAEAYMKQLDLPGFVFSSSGVEAAQYTVPTEVSKFTRIVLDKNPALKTTFHPRRTQTTEKLLQDPDVIVCLDKSVFDDAIANFGLDARKTQAWGIADIDKRVARIGTTLDDDAALPELEYDIFAKIRRHCDQLAAYLTQTAWVDVVDKQNHATGLRLPMAWVQDRGLWHRGVHVVVRTSDGKFVVGKRVNDIVFAPGMLEISLGGGVDSGESVVRAAQRETHEELGVELPHSYFKPLFLYQQTAFHPHYRKQTRCHLYVYTAQLPVHSQHLRPQPGEVAEVRLLTKRQVKHLLATHRMSHFGRLKTGYKLYSKAVAYSSLAG